MCRLVLAGVHSGGQIFALGFFRTRKFRTEFIPHSGLRISPEISHPSRIVLFTTRQFCVALHNSSGFHDCFANL